MYSGKIYVRHSFRYAQLLGILHDEVLPSLTFSVINRRQMAIRWAKVTVTFNNLKIYRFSKTVKDIVYGV